jgi:hypothetical protein
MDADLGTTNRVSTEELIRDEIISRLQRGQTAFKIKMDLGLPWNIVEDAIKVSGLDMSLEAQYQRWLDHEAYLVDDRLINNIHPHLVAQQDRIPGEWVIRYAKGIRLRKQYIR